jgi:hypothetical protein
LWVVVFAIIVMALTCVPYLIGAMRSGGDWRFSGFVIGVEDGNSYLAKMQLGAHGRWLFQLSYATEDHAPSFLFPFYILLGKVIGLVAGYDDPLRLHTALILGYHAVRLFWGFALLLASYQFLAELLPHIRQRRMALILVALGGGLGWLLLALHAPGQPLEFYSPEAFTFLDLFALPHLSASRVFFLAGLCCYLWAVRGGWAWLFPAGAAWFLMTIIQPLYMLVIFAILAAHIFILTLVAFRQRESELTRGVDSGGVAVRALWVAWAAASVGLPIVAYTFLLFSIEPTYQIWSQQNTILSPEPWHYVSAWGVLAVASLFGLRSLYRRNVVAWALVVGWLLSLPVLLYLPYNLQRRLAEGAYLPLAALAVTGLSVGLTRIFRLRLGKRVRRLAPAALVAICLPTTILLYVSSLIAVSNLAEPIYQTKDQAAAYVFLARSLPPRSVVLSSFEFGNAVPAYGDLIAFMGHGPETPNLSDKRATAASFYSKSTPNDQRFYDYGLIHAPYVVFGPHERALGGFDPNDPRQNNFLQKIFESGDYSVWSLKIGP